MKENLELVEFCCANDTVYDYTILYHQAIYIIVKYPHSDDVLSEFFKLVVSVKTTLNKEADLKIREQCLKALIIKSVINGVTLPQKKGELLIHKYKEGDALQVISEINKLRFKPIWIESNEKEIIIRKCAKKEKVNFGMYRTIIEKVEGLSPDYKYQFTLRLCKNDNPTKAWKQALIYIPSFVKLGVDHMIKLKSWILCFNLLRSTSNIYKEYMSSSKISNINNKEAEQEESAPLDFQINEPINLFKEECKDEERPNISDDKASVFTFCNIDTYNPNYLIDQVNQFKMNYLLIEGSTQIKIWEGIIKSKLHNSLEGNNLPNFKYINTFEELSEIVEETEESIRPPKSLSVWM